MQTIEQVLSKVQGMLGTVQESIMDDIENILQAGPVDSEDYEDNYRLPKMLLHVALLRAAESYTPMSWDKEAKSTIDNLKNF